MPRRDLLLMIWVCFSLATSAIVARLVVTNLAVPPLVFTVTRSALVLAFTLPWLWPLPRPRRWFLATAMLFGLGGFTLFFLGLRSAQPASVAIVNQLTIPFTAALAFVFLGERPRGQRLVGTALAIAGVATVMWKPGALGLSPGLGWIALSALASSAAVITIKRIPNLEPLRLQPWVALSALLPSALIAPLVDQAPWHRAWHAGWPLVAASVYSALVVSLLAQSVNYRLLRRHPANVTAPLMVLAPIFTMALGPLITGDTISIRLLIGGAIALGGVVLVVRAPSATALPQDSRTLPDEAVEMFAAEAH